MKIKKSAFIDQLSTDQKKRLKKRLQRNNSLLKKHGFVNYSDAGELLTGYSYGEFYDWDLYFENIYLSYFGISNFCRTNLETFLDQQLPSGFVARTLGIVHVRERDHFKPFLAQIAILGSKQTDNYNWLIGRYYERLKKYMDYWTWYQDFDKNGLSIWQGPGHSGLDTQFSRCGANGAMICEGVDLNSYLYLEYKSMQQIALKIGEDKDAIYFEEQADNFKVKINEILWDEEDGFYYDRNERTGERIKVMSVAGFTPLWAGIATKERARVIIEKHLLDKEKFWLNYPVATYSKQEPDFYQSIKVGGDECNTAGPTWIMTNYMIFHGLRKYGYKKEAQELADKTFKMVLAEEETREYFNSETGNGEGLNPFFGWSTLAYFMPLEMELDYDPTLIDNMEIKKLAEDYLELDFPMF